MPASNTDTDDKPARGFFVEVRKHAGAGSTYVWSGWTEDNGADAGCTEPITMVYDVASPTTHAYLVRVSSAGAYVNGNWIHSYVDPLISDETVTDVMVFHQAKFDDVKVYPPPLIGGPGGDDRWNVLATAAFALSKYDGGVNATYTFGDAVPGGAEFDDHGYHAATNRVYLADRKRWVYAHEVGHAVSEMASGDLGLEQIYSSASDGCGCNPSDGCVSGTAGEHRLLQKEWHSAAAVEGIATWYAQIIFNDVYSNADCSVAYWKGIDWDNDEDYDLFAGDTHDCIGDPDGPNGAGNWADEVDWLTNLSTAPDLGGCTGPLTNKGVEYEWWRYLWAMVTQHGHSVSDMWGVWDCAGPGSWDPNSSNGDVADNPANLVNECAWDMIANTSGTDAGPDHGLDH